MATRRPIVNVSGTLQELPTGDTIASGVAAAAGGSSAQVQYNDGGSLAGDGGLIWDKVLKQLTVFSSNGGGGALVVSDQTAGSGANFKLIGDGATTPSKTVRVQGGTLQVVNDAYNSVILSIDDSGNVSAANLATSTGLYLKNQNASGFYLEHLYSSAGVTNQHGVTWDVANGDRSVFLAGNLAFGGNFTKSGANSLTLTTTADSSLTVPATGTLTAIQSSVIVGRQPAPTSKSAAATLTAAEVLVGLIQYTGAAATLTLPTGTTLDAAITLAVDEAFDVSVLNTGSGTATLGTATGLTLTGAMTVATGTSQRFRFRKTAANAFTVYRA